MSARQHETLSSALAELSSAPRMRLALALTVAVIPLLASPWWIRASWHPIGDGMLQCLFAGFAGFALARGLRRIDLPWERRFWSVLAAAAVCRFVAELVTTLAVVSEAPGLRPAVEILHGAGYALLLIALDHRPHVMPRRDGGASEQTLGPLLLVLLVAGYTLYFPLLPLLGRGTVALGPIPSLPFHMALDLVTSCWLARLWHRATTPRWRGLYGFLLGAFVLSAWGRALGLAASYGTLSLPPLATTLPVLLASILLVVTATLRHRPFGIQAETTAESELPFEIPAHVGLRTLCLAIAFPCLHILLYSIGLLDNALRTSRELVVALWLPPLALVALQRHLALRRYSRQQLERRARLSSALQQSQANLRLLHQKQEAALDQRRAEERFSTFFRMSPTGLLIADLAEGEVQEVNANFERLVGLDADELTGRPLRDLELWRDGGVAEGLLEHIRQGEFLHRQIVSLRTRGGWHDVLLSASALDLGLGEGMLLVIRDIDDQRRAASHLDERRHWRELAVAESERLLDETRDGDPSLDPSERKLGPG